MHGIRSIISYHYTRAFSSGSFIQILKIENDPDE